MNYQNFVWLFVALALVLLPAVITGCGADDESTGQRIRYNTIGAGNAEDFASCTGSIR
ncbi:MAG TPA: hypothetical protein PLP29_03265 [Candidatus Ozemobacteraceae bacterium]|nr:hypothetical protein [Candidatus Ozemobacteraceae bacterium]